jgi:RHS repeat-associated protein
VRARQQKKTRKGAPPAETVHAPTGEKIASMIGQMLDWGFVSLPGGASAIYTTSGLAQYRHPDWLGSLRLMTTPSQTVRGDVAYAPYGETYAQTGSVLPSFTGVDGVSVYNEYDFPAREYGIQGRWPSPDPAGLAAVSPSDPQSWNRYAYVRNSPTNMTDPSGMMMRTGANVGGGGGFSMLGTYNGSFAADEPSWDPITLYIGDDITPVNAALYAGTYDLGGGLLGAVSFSNFQIDPNTGTYDGFGQETISFSVFSSVTTTPDGNWMPHSPAPVRPDDTVTDEKKLMTFKVAGMKASHDLGCVLNAEAGMLPFVGPLFDAGSSSSLDSADGIFGAVGAAGIVASQFNNSFSAGVESLSSKVGPLGTAVGTVNGALKANACIDNGLESSGF